MTDNETPNIDPKYEKRYDDLGKLEWSDDDIPATNNDPVMPSRPKNKLVRPERKPVNIVKLPDATAQVTYDITPSSQQIVRMETSAVDRATGFHIAFGPIAFLAGGVVLVLAIFYKNVELWSLLALLIFGMTTLIVWLLAWVCTLFISPEGVSLFEAWNKWGVIKTEQRERHKFYRDQVRK